MQSACVPDSWARRPSIAVLGAEASHVGPNVTCTVLFRLMRHNGASNKNHGRRSKRDVCGRFRDVGVTLFRVVGDGDAAALNADVSSLEDAGIKGLVFHASVSDNP